MSKSEIRGLLAVCIWFFAILIPGLTIFKIIPSLMPWLTWQWLLVSAVGCALAGMLYSPRDCWKSAILWSSIGSGGLMGQVLYLYVRTVMLPTGFLLKIELALGFLIGIVPGILLYRYWFGDD